MFDLNISLYNFEAKTPNINTLQQKIKIIKSSIVNIVRNNYDVDINDVSQLYNNKLYQLNNEIEKTIKQLKIDLRQNPIFSISVIEKDTVNSKAKNPFMPNNFYAL